MIDYRDQIGSVIDALRVILPDRHRWFGELSPSWPKRAAERLDPYSRRGYLAAQIQSRLYQQFYQHGVAVPAGQDAHPIAAGGETDFVRALSEANSGTGSWELNWSVVAREDGGVWAQRNGLTVFVPPDAYLTETPATSFDASVAVRMPKGLSAQLPGFYLAQGDEPLQPAAGDVLVRLYWHVSAEGAPALVASITSRLNSAHVPFHFKVLNNPDAYRRNDAAILYLTRDDLSRAASSIERIVREVRHHLLPGVPALTKQLAPGLALAEDPRNGESFGLHRCRLLAEAFIEAAEREVDEPADLLDAVAERFQQEGIDLSHPYLNPGSIDDYDRILVFDRSRPQFTIKERDQASPKDGEASPSRDSYRDVARRIGDRLVENAIWHDERCTWLGPRMALPGGHGPNHHATYGVIGPDVYSGTAGIALFLAQLYAETGDEPFRRAAQGAIAQAVRAADQLADQGRIGFYTGWPGVAVACTQAGRLLKDRRLAERIPREIVERCAPMDQPFEPDLLSGGAGAAIAFLDLWRCLDDERCLDEAVSLGDRLLATAKRRGSAAWWPVRTLSGTRPLTGFAHGAAGIAFALLQLFAATGEERFRATSEAAFAFERHNFHPGLQNWLDLRYPLERDRFGPGALAASVWCHGSGGIAISRLAAWNFLGKETYLDEAEIALTTTRIWLDSDNASSNNLWSLCHGLSGNADILLHAAEILPDQASSLTRTATEIADVGQAAISSASESGDLFDTDEPGLFLGLAGIGYFFLRMANQKIPSVLVPRAS
jgi:hypothetical protein